MGPILPVLARIYPKIHHNSYNNAGSTQKTAEFTTSSEITFLSKCSHFKTYHAKVAHHPAIDGTQKVPFSVFSAYSGRS